MTTATDGNDPQSDLQDYFKDVSIAKKLAEIGYVAGENPDEKKPPTY